MGMEPTYVAAGASATAYTLWLAIADAFTLCEISPNVSSVVQIWSLPDLACLPPALCFHVAVSTAFFMAAGVAAWGQGASPGFRPGNGAMGGRDARSLGADSKCDM